MKNTGRRQPFRRDRRHLVLRQCVLLTEPPERPTPQIGDVKLEYTECPRIGHRVVHEDTRHHCPQLAALVGNGIVHAVAQLLLDLPGTNLYRGSTVGLHLPLPALRRHPHEWQRTAWADVVRYSFVVWDLHPVLPAGLPAQQM